MEPNQGFSINSHGSPPAAGCHRLPQIPSMGRNVRTAQSKTSAKLNFEAKPRDETAILHVEGTSRVVQILTDGISELTEIKDRTPNVTPSSFSVEQNFSLSNDADKMENSSSSVTPRRKRQRNGSGNSNKLKKGTAAVNVPSASNDTSSSLSSDPTEAALQPSDKTNTTDQSHSKSANCDTLHLETSEKGAPGNAALDVCDSVLESPLVDTPEKKESPLEKKKRTSKLGIENPNKSSGSAESIPVTKESDCVPILTPKSVDAMTPAAVKAEEEMDVDSTTSKGHVPRCVIILPTEVPSESQLEKLLAMQSTNYDLQYPPPWSEGDLLWAKVSGHPYWPCMISRCPFSKMFTRIKGDVRVVRSYHVQFFGNEGERGWINEPSLMLFEGKLKFLDMAQTEVSKGKRGKSAYNPFKINISRRHAWNIAVDEAEAAMPLSKEERNVQYTFEYVFLDDLKKEQQKLKLESQKTEGVQAGEVAAGSRSKTNSKRKRAPSEERSLSPVSSKQKRRKLDVVASSPVVPVGAETSFDTYYANHRSSVIETHPEWDTPLVFEYVRQQWESEKKKTSKNRSKSPHTASQNTSINKSSPSVLPTQLKDVSAQGKPTKLARMLSRGNLTPTSLPAQEIVQV
ncbi:unnamed protein product, partial [Candidula unifasciata]